MEVKSGFVYFVSAYHMVPCGYFKVGITRKTSFKPRIHQIQCNSPFCVVTCCVVRHSDPEGLESLILDRFKRYRIRGEWFALTPMHIHGFDENVVRASRIFEKKVSRVMKRCCDMGVVE